MGKRWHEWKERMTPCLALHGSLWFMEKERLSASRTGFVQKERQLLCQNGL